MRAGRAGSTRPEGAGYAGFDHVPVDGVPMPGVTRPAELRPQLNLAWTRSVAEPLVSDLL
jgi:hypothetical protein